MNPVTLPRPLVLKLLHLAQVDPGAGFIVRAPDGTLRLATLADDVKSDIFAFYRTAPRADPAEEDVARWQARTRLFLGVSVGTKGVLQLRAWQPGAAGLEPVEVSLAEVEPQGMGTSRKA
ncbi:MAG TPA: hypothetical protein VFK21_00855 [Gammaproteobacteria bacterium]|nr:hypothetical protein [Gammaproteobacteria bacterium]